MLLSPSLCDCDCANVTSPNAYKAKHNEPREAETETETETETERGRQAGRKREAGSEEGGREGGREGGKGRDLTVLF